MFEAIDQTTQLNPDWYTKIQYVKSPFFPAKPRPFRNPVRAAQRKIQNTKKKPVKQSTKNELVAAYSKRIHI